jgi:hypothetical protein
MSKTWRLGQSLTLASSVDNDPASFMRCLQRPLDLRATTLPGARDCTKSLAQLVGWVWRLVKILAPTRPFLQFSGIRKTFPFASFGLPVLKALLNLVQEGAVR